MSAGVRAGVQADARALNGLAGLEALAGSNDGQLGIGVVMHKVVV